MIEEKNVTNTHLELGYDDDQNDEMLFKITKIVERNKTKAEMINAISDWTSTKYPHTAAQAATLMGSYLERSLLANSMASLMSDFMKKKTDDVDINDIKGISKHKITIPEEVNVNEFLTELKALSTEYGGNADAVDDGMIAIGFTGPEQKAEFEDKLNKLKEKYGLNIKGMSYHGPQTEA